jgi:small subunit ribosomal protein S5
MEEEKKNVAEVVNETAVTDNKNNKNFNKDRKPRREFKKNFEPKKKLLEEKVISITRVTKVTKGGRHFRFAATMAVGDGKGLVGIGTGKSMEVPEAIKKGIQAANKNLVKISLEGGRTIPHEQIGVCGRAKVMLKPAKEGTGIIAGGAVRAILEIAGVKDIVSKSLGSNTQVNTAKATLIALQTMRTPEHIAELRGKKREDL